MVDTLKKRANYFILGKPGTGKSTFAQALVDFFDYDPHNVVILSPNKDDWNDVPYQVVRDDFSKVIKDHIKEPKKEESLIVLDDVNYNIESKGNPYADLFTRSRHNNLNVVITGHTAKAVPPVGRSGCTYICAMAMTGREILKALGTMIGTQKLLIHSMEVKKDNKYNCMVYDTTEDDMVVVNAKDLECESSSDTEEANVVSIPHIRTEDMAGGDAIYTGMSANPMAGVAFNMSKQAQNMYDSSRNNIVVNNTLKQEQRLEDNKMSQRIKLDNYKFEYKMKLIAMKDDTYHAIQRPVKSIEDKKEIISNINHLVKPKKPFTIYDTDNAYQSFMNKFYERIPAPKDNKVLDTIADRDNLQGLITSGVREFVNNRKASRPKLQKEEYSNMLEWLDNL